MILERTDVAKQILSKISEREEMGPPKPGDDQGSGTSPAAGYLWELETDYFCELHFPSVKKGIWTR